jgi:hypothetical protein
MSDEKSGGLLGQLLLPGFKDAGASTSFRSVVTQQDDQVSEEATSIILFLMKKMVARLPHLPRPGDKRREKRITRPLFPTMIPTMVVSRWSS